MDKHECRKFMSNIGNFGQHTKNEFVKTTSNVTIPSLNSVFCFQLGLLTACLMFRQRKGDIYFSLLSVLLFIYGSN